MDSAAEMKIALSFAIITAIAAGRLADELAPLIPFHELRLAVEALHDALRR